MKKKLFKFNIWSKDLFPLNRSLTGEGNLKTLNYIKKNINKNFKIKKVKSGTRCYDWKIPLEWKVKNAYFADGEKKYCDFKKNNLHLIGYSTKIKKKVHFNQLKRKLHFLKEQPNAIPYITSYYNKNWGFCISYNQYKKLNKNKSYKVNIDSSFKKGNMHYGEFFLKGKSKKEILITSYICHPSMANNELSGMLVASALSKLIRKSKYSLRILLIPETIGAIYFIHKFRKHLQNNLVAGFNLSCVGDSNSHTLISSINENTYSDVIAQRILSKYKYTKKNFLFRGSNERQFGCKNLNLPFVTICRSRFGDYKKYHTSLDNLSFIKNKSMLETTKIMNNIINEINASKIFIKNTYCEPFLSKHNLAKKVSKYKSQPNKEKKILSDFIAYCGKDNDLKTISKFINLPINKVKKMSKLLSNKKIIKPYV